MSKAITPADFDVSPPLTVESLVNGGNGLIRYNGQVVFIPKVAVGDVVRFRITHSKKNYAEAQLVEIVLPSCDRREPLCPVADECGGCQWQHLPYHIQAQWKNSLFRDSLIRKCRVSENTILPIIVAPKEFGYRSRVQIKCYNTRDGFITGFYRPKSRYVVSVETCPLISSEMNHTLKALRQLISGSKHADHIPQIDLATDSDGKIAITVHYLGNDKSGLADRIKVLSNHSDVILQMGNKKQRDIIAGDGNLHIAIDNPELRLAYQAGSFAQINLDQNRRMVSIVKTLIPLTGNESVVDLYCGMGNFSLPLARKVKSVIGVEESSSSIKMACSNAKRLGVHNASFICDNAETAIDTIRQTSAVDILVLDPPRNGAYAIAKKIANSDINHIVYVSCDTQTLARDLECLVNNGYELVSSQPLDMFPQTYHCESINYLKKRETFGLSKK